MLRQTYRRLALPSLTNQSLSSRMLRPFSTEATPSMTPAESAIADILTSKLSPSALLVQDVSGGCGSMYSIDIASSKFRGLSMLKQQRLVNAALGDLVKSWHGVQIRTKVPDDE